MSRCPCPREWDNGTHPLQVLQTLFEPMGFRFGNAQFFGAVSDAQSFSKELLELFRLCVFQFLYSPIEFVSICLRKLGLKGAHFFSRDASRLGDVHLEMRPVCNAIVQRAAQADDGIHDVLTGGCAALIPGFSCMMNEKNRDASSSQIKKPALDGLP